MNEKTVSLIIPVYNTEKYLDRCIDSVVNQTYNNLEIILVNDGSSDSSPKMCNTWAEKDSRIKVIHKENDGLANARNSGIKACSGDYVMFVDSDDYIDFDMVEFLLNLSLKYDADVSRCGFYLNYENGRQTKEYDNVSIQILDRDQRIIELTTAGYSGTAWNKLYKRDVIKTHLYCKSDGCAEDIMHNFRVYKDVEKTVFCDEPKYHYVIRDDSITGSKFSYGAFDIIKAKKTILDFAQDNDRLLPYAVKGYVMSAFIVLSGCIQNDAFPKEAKELVTHILKYKKEIYSSDLYTKQDKLKVLILSLSPKLYSKIIKLRARNDIAEQEKK